MPYDVIVANKALIGVAVFVALFAGERAFSATPSKGGAARLIRNGVLWACLLALSPLIVLPLTAFAAEHPLWRRPADWNVAAALAADIVAFDLWAYAVHRAYHEVPLMRRFHRVHHLDEHLDTTSAVRFHPGEVALSALLRMVPIVLFAIPFAHVVVFETLLLVASLFHHSNLRLRSGFERALSRVVVTPSIHWVHHHATPADTNSNYAAVFSLWDPMFRTQSRTARTPDMKIGVEGVEDRSALGLLLAPFSRDG
jgi:sterol desaturase/sphingolipid hydroxylase (fatty acid hydroxylase superfamily)